MATGSSDGEGLNIKTTYVRAIAKLNCRTVAPETLVGRAIRLYDADALSDDLLSTSKVKPDGTAGFLFDLSTSRSLDSLFETKPDLYCVVSGDDGRIRYRSTIHANTDFLSVDPESGEQHRTGREYVLNLYTKSRQMAFSYRAPLPTKQNEWTEVSVPLADFIPTLIAKSLRPTAELGQTPLAAAELGLKARLSATAPRPCPPYPEPAPPVLRGVRGRRHHWPGARGRAGSWPRSATP